MVVDTSRGYPWDWIDPKPYPESLRDPTTADLTAAVLQQFLEVWIPLQPAGMQSEWRGEYNPPGGVLPLPGALSPLLGLRLDLVGQIREGHHLLGVFLSGHVSLQAVLHQEARSAGVAQDGLLQRAFPPAGAGGAAAVPARAAQAASKLRLHGAGGDDLPRRPAWAWV